jgi:hypothetical protein
VAPANNFFGSARANLGAAVSISGDLPQLSGTPGSMSGIDMHIINVTSLLSVGASSINFSIPTGESDGLIISSLFLVVSSSERNVNSHFFLNTKQLFLSLEIILFSVFRVPMF